MTSPPPEPLDYFSESSKALLEVVMEKEQTDLFRGEMKDCFTLLEENNRLQAEVASLKENLPFKDKYENLQREFRKVAAERDSLRAQELNNSHRQHEYDKLKVEYQSLKGKLATYEMQEERQKASLNAFSNLEPLYQVFKADLFSRGIDIRRIPTTVNLQFILQNDMHRGSIYQFNRTSADKWSFIGKTI